MPSVTLPRRFRLEEIAECWRRASESSGIGENVRPEAERELIRECRAGKARSYEPIVHAYEGAGMRIALGILGNAEDARDALQLSFVKAWQSLSRFDPTRRFAPWFFQILRNQCRDLLRSRKSRFAVEALDEALEHRPADPSSGPERHVDRVFARNLLWKALEEIGTEHREILVLKELEGLSYREIAEVLNIPDGTVASRLYHARAALKSTLETMGVTK